MGHQRYYCFNCHQYSVETKGTPLYKKKLSERKIKEICKELVEKKGIRKVSKHLHVNKNSVCKLLDDLSHHALQMTNYLVHDLHLGVYEVDEILTFVKKTKKNLSPSMIASLNQAKQQLQRA
jgi:hypothetical protein